MPLSEKDTATRHQVEAGGATALQVAPGCNLQTDVGQDPGKLNILEKTQTAVTQRQILLLEICLPWWTAWGEAFKK